LRFGGLGLGGLMLADLLRLRAEGKAPRTRSIIMVLLSGGPGHIDMYDLKPDAPAEIRGEFRPIDTNVPGMQICELMPRQARIADRLTIIRNMQFTGDTHTCEELTTGWRTDPGAIRQKRPAHGSIVSSLQGQLGDIPPYVLLTPPRAFPIEFGPLYLGPAHRPFCPLGEDYDNLALRPGMTHERLGERKHLLRSFDTVRRDLDVNGELPGMDRFTAQALELLTCDKTRNALDITREPERIKEKYGITGAERQKYSVLTPNLPLASTRWLQARRLVEAGVPVVNFVWPEFYHWDSHYDHFPFLREMVPMLDQSVSALVSDLHERGLDKDVAVVVWGEMGRTPRINNPSARGVKNKPGRDHWCNAGFALMAGGGWRMGQVIGKTNAWAAAPVGTPYTPQNVLATIYRHLGIDPATTLKDHSGRPHPLLDDCATIKELA
jgi:hypothetical protein